MSSLNTFEVGRSASQRVFDRIQRARESGINPARQRRIHLGTEAARNLLARYIASDAPLPRDGHWLGVPFVVETSVQPFYIGLLPNPGGSRE